MAVSLVMYMVFVNVIVPSHAKVTKPPAAMASRNPASSHVVTTPANIEWAKSTARSVRGKNERNAVPRFVFIVA